MATTSVFTLDDKGNKVGPTTVQIDDALVNQSAIASKAIQALQANATFLAIPSPSVAQNAAQITSLTKQVNALIRLAMSVFDSSAGT